MIEEASDEDLAMLRAQLGRPVRGLIGVAARTSTGEPLVVATRPRLEDGTPFPTFYYLTHPAATAIFSRLEADGKMREYEARLNEDSELGKIYTSAHENYLKDRSEYGSPDEIDGISAGGMPTRVKCLHALAAHALAVGEGVNPIGDFAVRDALAVGWLR